MKVFATLGVLIVIFIFLGALISYRSSKRAAEVGPSYDEAQAERARRERHEGRADAPSPWDTPGSP
jgi:hypothetical protein